MNETDEVIFEDFNRCGIIILNRPKALNALTLSMEIKIRDVLKHWENEKELVIIKGAGDRAFCAGGDIRYVLAYFLLLFECYNVFLFFFSRFA